MSTVARIAGNLLSGKSASVQTSNDKVKQAVLAARMIVAETKRTEPQTPVS